MSVQHSEQFSLRSGEPVQEQLYRYFMRRLYDGSFVAGDPLPSGRQMAMLSGLSRHTVMAVYRQLKEEGVVEARPGCCYRVTTSIEQRLLRRPGAGQQDSAVAPCLLFSPSSYSPGQTNQPDTRRFPFKFWNREWMQMSGRTHRQSRLPEHGWDIFGLPELRREIARMLEQERGMACSWEDIIVLESYEQALFFACHLLLTVNQKAWVEEPCPGGILNALTMRGNLVEPVELQNGSGALQLPEDDEFGFLYISPDCQYPSGRLLSGPEREALLEWAVEHGHWLLEDGFGCEFSDGPGIFPVKALDPDAPVVYLGHFERLMFPGLNISYLIVPDDLQKRAATALQTFPSRPSAITQRTLASFLEQGMLAPYFRKMQRIYEQKWVYLSRQLSESAAGQRLRWQRVDLNILLRGSFAEKRLSEYLRQQGFECERLSGFSFSPGARQRGILMGYGNVTKKDLARLVSCLEDWFRAEDERKEKAPLSSGA